MIQWRGKVTAAGALIAARAAYREHFGSLPSAFYIRPLRRGELDFDLLPGGILISLEAFQEIAVHIVGAFSPAGGTLYGVPLKFGEEAEAAYQEHVVAVPNRFGEEIPVTVRVVHEGPVGWLEGRDVAGRWKTLGSALVAPTDPGEPPGERWTWDVPEDVLKRLGFEEEGGW